VRIGIAAPYGISLSWAVRLQDEGHDVRMWISDSQYKTVGDGIVPKAGTWDEFTAHVRDGLALYELSKLGEKADALRRAGIPTLCGGTFMDRLEGDRAFGVEMARAAGCDIPAYEEFASVTDALARARELDGALYFKTDRLIDSDATHGADTGDEMVEYLEGLIERHGGHGACILQEKVEGVPLSTARWWNGMDWVGPYQADYENKKLMNDNVGPSTGCAFNVVWFYDDAVPEVARRLHWENFTPLFRKHQAPPGIYDINAMIAPDGTAWFLEWTPRLGYDSEMTSMLLVPDLGRHLRDVATGHDPLEPALELAYSVKISIPPYPWEHGNRDDKGGSDGTLLRGAHGLWDGGFIPYFVRRSKRFPDALEIAGPEGEVGLVAAVGDDLETAHEECIESAKALRIAGLQYRTDGAKDIAAAAEKLAEAGYDLHPGLLGGDE